MSFGRLLFLALIAVAIVLPIRLWVAEPISIATPSMEPTYPGGAFVLMDKVPLSFREPRRGEVIVFTSPVGEDKELVKRVIGIPGDTVELKAKKVFVNGTELEEGYVQHTRAEERLAGDNLGPLTVPAKGLFVLGDNRDESKDSSAWKDPESGEPIYFLPRRRVTGLVRGFY